MGYGFMVWAVDTDKLKQVAGSKDEKLRRMIGGRFKRELASLDDLFKHAIAAGGPNTYEALRQIIDGTIPEDARGGIYAYAFQLIVEHFGRFLDNGAVYPWNSPDFSAVDGALEKMSVPFKVSSLYGFSLPVKVPSPDDFPSAGWVTPRKVKEVHEAFSQAKKVKMDAGAKEIVDCVRGWFEAAATANRGLVSYYH